MEIFMTSAAIVILIAMALWQLWKGRHILQHNEKKSRLMAYVMFATVFNLICNLITHDQVCTRMPFIVFLCASSLTMLSLSFASYERVRHIVWGEVIFAVISGIYFIMAGLGLIPAVPPRMFALLCVLLVFMDTGAYIYFMYIRFRDLKNVMRSGSVWTNLSMAVDAVYMSLMMVYAMIYVFSGIFTGYEGSLADIVFMVMFLSLCVALGIRFVNSSIFVVMSSHESRIVESMKISSIETVQETTGITVLYKNIYDRVQEYFASNKPYLNNNLTINDIVGVVFSNKLYISKAISQFTGRNFCQFVNYYRIVHAVELFRDNPDLKVLELAMRSGFNSAVSFGMAFKLYMGEKPGDWCRKERFRREKLKK